MFVLMCFLIIKLSLIERNLNQNTDLPTGLAD